MRNLVRDSMINRMNWPNWLASQHTARIEKSLHRNRPVYSGRQNVDCIFDDQLLVNFSSNDYLGLAGHPKLSKCLSESAELYGVGSGASHMVCGHHELHHELEDAVARFVGSERVLLLSSGYLANIGLPQALTGRDDLILSDRLNHASLIDGVRLSRAKHRRYRHRDIEQVRQIVSDANYRRCLLVSDGVFSMDGDVAPVAELRTLADENNGLLLLDDAHGIGVLGSEARGTLAVDSVDASVNFNNVLLMGTLGKAFGCYGAFVAGNADLIEHIEQQCRSYIYTTALPPPLAACAMTALDLVREGGLTKALLQNIQFFKTETKGLELPLLESMSAIQPLIIGDNAKTLELAEQLHLRGFLVGAIRPPTVPEGTARLRITLSANHTRNQIGRLLVELSSLLSDWNE